MHRFCLLRGMLDLKDILRQHTGYAVPRALLRPLECLLHIEELNDIISAGRGLAPQPFLQYVFRRFDVSCEVHYTVRIDDDRYIFVANHPFGALDGMLLADMLLRRWRDVGVVVNDMLSHIAPLGELWIPVNKFGRQHSARLYHDSLCSATKQILTFPAGLCSRWRDGRVEDLAWQTRFVKDAERYDRRVVPIFVAGELSQRFYNIYRLRRALRISANVELLLLVDELFRQRGSRVPIVVGQPIDVLQMAGSAAARCEAIRQQVYDLKQYVETAYASSALDSVWRT